MPFDIMIFFSFDRNSFDSSFWRSFEAIGVGLFFVDCQRAKFVKMISFSFGDHFVAKARAWRAISSERELFLD